MSTASDDFDVFLKQREAASTAFVNGDVAALDGVSTHTSPASIFGPNGTCIQGAEQVNAANASGAKVFRPGSANAFEIMHMAADHHLAYWVGIQRSVVRMHGQDQGTPMDLRVTEIFRRENGQWKLIHRHADQLASEDGI